MKIIAHRGGLETNYKPNTIECLLESMENNNVDGVEIDIRLTKDFKIVIHHDYIINFSSNGTGIINRITLKNLLKLNFGSEKYPSKITTLDNFLKRVKTDKVILIEIKEKNIKIIKVLLKTLKKYKLNYYICSFNFELLKKVKELSLYKTGLVIGLGQNITKLINEFDFNMITRFYQNYVDLKKETFIWSICNIKNIDTDYLITDFPSRF